MKKGEVTAFLSLIFILLMSVVASVVESASMQVLKNRKRGDMDRALESVFAEYQKDLLEDFEIFSLEGTYETGNFSEENMMKRLETYGVRDAEQTVEKIQFLTDEQGRPFREQVIAYMKQKMGISQLEELAGLTGQWENQSGKIEEYEQEGTNVGKDLELSLQESEQSLPEEGNPLNLIEAIQKAGLVNIVMRGKEVSSQSVSEAELLSHRSLQKGKGEFKVRDDTEGMTSNLYFASYLIEQFHAADELSDEGKLSYELEYILNGSGNDRDNLEAVLKKLSFIRLAANYGYLLTDAEKKAEAETMALVLAGIIALPALAELIKQAILLAWAYGESIMDLRTLLSGGRISLIKTKEEWQLSLSNLLKLGTEDDPGDGKDAKEGLSYKEYLRMLLIFENQEECTMRSLGAIELRMKKKAGEFFQADYCISKLRIRANCKIRRKIFYEFSTEYGYQ